MKNKTCYIISLIIVISLLNITLVNNKYANNTRKLSLKESLNIVKKQDVILKELGYQEKLNQEKYLSNTLDFLPKINSELERASEVSFLNPRGATIFSLNTSLNLPIYDRTIIYNRKQIKKEILKNKYAIQTRLNQLSLSIADLYIHILHLEEVIQILEEEYQNTKNSYEINKKKLRLKRILALDLLLIEGLMIEAYNRLKFKVDEYNEAKLKLINQLRLKNKDIELDKKTKLFSDFKLKNLKHYINTNQRKEIKIKELESLIAQDIYEIERSIYYPKIELISDIELGSVGDYSLSDRLSWSVFLIASFSIIDELSIYLKGGAEKSYRLDNVKDKEAFGISLFDDNSKRTKKASAKYAYLNKIEELKEYKLTIKEEITNAYNTLKQSQNELKKTKLYIRIGQGLVKKVKFEYQIGKKGVEDIIEEERKRIIYRIENEIAKLNINKAILNLKMTTGTLWQEL